MIKVRTYLHVISVIILKAKAMIYNKYMVAISYKGIHHLQIE